MALDVFSAIVICSVWVCTSRADQAVSAKTVATAATAMHARILLCCFSLMADYWMILTASGNTAASGSWRMKSR